MFLFCFSGKGEHRCRCHCHLCTSSIRCSSYHRGHRCRGASGGVHHWRHTPAGHGESQTQAPAPEHHPAYRPQLPRNNQREYTLSNVRIQEIGDGKKRNSSIFLQFFSLFNNTNWFCFAKYRRVQIKRTVLKYVKLNDHFFILKLN